MAERGLETTHLHGRKVIALYRRINRTIKDHVSNVCWEKSRVGCTEECSIGVTQVIELVLSQQRADHVKVLRCIDRVNMLIQVSAQVLAALREVSRIFLCLFNKLSGSSIRVFITACASCLLIAVFVAHAANRSRRTDPSGVQRYDVERPDKPIP